MLITAGPTREPIDNVRFLGNRSSGSLGIELAKAATDAGLDTTLALGKSVHDPNIENVALARFDQTSELRSLLREHMPASDILVMAAAVADHTPKTRHPGKLSHASAETMTLEFVATPDLLAEVGATARPEQLIVGFALEPHDQLETSASRKLQSKKADLIVANPLETMESDSIDATLIAAPWLTPQIDLPPTRCTKRAFAKWLVPRLVRWHEQKVNP